MGKRRLIESMEVQLVMDHNVDIASDNMLSEWGSVPYGQLSLLLVHLRFLAHVHQTHHWTCKGDAFFGDHLMFEKLYNQTIEDIDAIAEKAVGLGSEETVGLPLQVKQLARLTEQYGSSLTIPRAGELARRSMTAEINFLKIAANMSCSLKEAGLMTRGLDNLLAGIEDRHEGHVYFLKQKCGGQ
jgi:DNA-binding ferritin-like protein